jgi:DNA modification methylase
MIEKPLLLFPDRLAEEISNGSDGAEGGGAISENSDVHPKNRLNDMTGAEWLYFTKSILKTSYPSVYGHRLRKAHGANKPPQLMALLIEFFTKAGQRVLDPFAGVGGTLIGASITSPGPRRCVGIEISEEWASIYEEVLSTEPDLSPQEIVIGDCLDVMDRWIEGQTVHSLSGAGLVASEAEPFDFILTDPPYNIHLKQTMSSTAGGAYTDEFTNRRTDYNMRSDHDRDLANLPDHEAYLDAMEQVFGRCFRLLKPARYMAVIVRNAYQDGEYQFTHAELAACAKRAGFVPKGEIVWYQTGSRLRPYGYPYNYIPNISHQFILVLQRPMPKALPKRQRKVASNGA